MGGKASRDKGSRGERQLRDELTKQGWINATRIPLSGAMKGYKGDVIARHPSRGTDTNFECKVRCGLPFKALYASLDGRPESLGPIGLSVPDLGEFIISFKAIDVMGYNKQVFAYPTADNAKLIRKVKSLKPLLGSSEILAVKQDRCRFIFIRYV